MQKFSPLNFKYKISWWNGWKSEKLLDFLCFGSLDDHFCMIRIDVFFFLQCLWEKSFSK